MDKESFYIQNTTSRIDDEKFLQHVERLLPQFDGDADATEQALIEWMVQNGWEIGVSGNGGNVFWPPDKGDPNG